MGDMNEGKGISVLIDIGEVMPGGVPIYTYRNFPRKPGLTVEQSLAGLGKKGLFADIGIVIPDSLVTDCVRLCCSLCLLENDPSVISPDVLADDRARFERPATRSTSVKPIGVEKWVGTWGSRSRCTALPPPAHGFGVDGQGSGGASDRSQSGERSSIGRWWRRCQWGGGAGESCRWEYVSFVVRNAR